MEEVVRGMSSSLSTPLTVKMRMGKKKEKLTAHGTDTPIDIRHRPLTSRLS
jgi:tRNA-dihydrouridine synthase